MSNDNKSNIYLFATIAAFACLAFIHWVVVLFIYVFVLLVISSWTQKREEETEAKQEIPSRENFQNIELRDNFNSSITFTIGRESNYDDRNIQWHKTNEIVNVKGIEIKGGMFYTSPTTTSLSSVVSKNLSVSNNVGYSGQLGYWPSYSRITPEQRKVYLNWLANGRKDPIDIGYVFIFFYGLEYRYFEEVLKDKKLALEVPDIVKEVERLLKVYRSSGSFNGYASRLLEFIKISSKSYQVSEIDYFDLFDNKNIWEMPLLIRVQLGRTIAKKQPIPAGLALLWLKYSFSWNSRTAARRCSSEFYDLFVERYTELYGDGIVVISKSKGLKLSYRPASKDMSYGDNNVTVADIADIENIQAPLEKLSIIANNISNELDLYSRFIGPEEKGSRQEAVLYLPSALRTKRFKDNINNMKKKYTTKSRVSFGSLLSDIGLDDKVSQKSIPLIKDLLKDNGLIIVGNNLKGIKHDDIISIFISNNGLDIDAKDLEMPKAVIQTIGCLLPKDNNTLNSDVFINSLHKGISEQKYLKSILIDTIHSGCKTSSIRNFVKGLKNAEIFMETVISGLSSFVPITPAVTKELEAIGKMLGLEGKEFHSLLYRAQNQQSVSKNKTKKGLNLDEIGKLKNESTEISKKLAEGVFSDTADKKTAKDKPVKKLKSFLGLNEKQEAFFQEIRKQKEWQIDILSEKAKKHKLMLEGVLEEINEKVYDLKNTTPIEIDGNRVYVDIEMLKDIK